MPTSRSMARASALSAVGTTLGVPSGDLTTSTVLGTAASSPQVLPDGEGPLLEVIYAIEGLTPPPASSGLTSCRVELP